MGCEECFEWFHEECVGISAEVVGKMEEWKCSFCSNAPDADGNRQWTLKVPKGRKGRAAPILVRNDRDTPKANGMQMDDELAYSGPTNWAEIERYTADKGKALNIKLQKYKKQAEKLVKEAGHHIGDTMVAGGLVDREADDELVEDLIANDIMEEDEDE